MKVFAYNTETGCKGSEVIGNVNCQAYGNRSRIDVKLPAPRNDVNIDVADYASNAQNKPIRAADFGQKAVCFCTGKLTAGTDSFWNWVILVDPS